MTLGRYFSYDGCYVEFHDKLEDARARAEESLAAYRDEAPDGWAEEAYGVCWGQVLECATVTMSRPRTEDDVAVDPLIDTIEEIELKSTTD